MRKTKLTFLLAMIVGATLLAQEDLYDPDHVTVIELTFAESNWHEIMNANQEAESNERLIGSCVINGVAFDSVGVKYKGNSSFSTRNTKNPFNIKLNHIKGKQDYQGFYTLKLSNGANDPSWVREVLSYEIARKYMVAPLSNYARVYVNDQYLGLYSSSESINKKFMGDYLYCDDENARVKCNPVMSGPPGSGGGNTKPGCNQSYGSDLIYLGEDTACYEDFYELMSDQGWVELRDFTRLLTDSPETMEEYLDVDAAIWMCAFDNLLVNLDSYIGPIRQNYYLIKDNNGRFVPIVWDLNESFAGFPMIDMGPPSGGGMSSMTDLDMYLRAGDDTYPLLKAIYFTDDTYWKMYIAHMRTMMNENFANGEFKTRAQNWQNVADAAVQEDQNGFFNYTDFQTNLTGTVTAGGGGGPSRQLYGIFPLMDARVSYLESQTDMAAQPPVISDIVEPSGDIMPNSTVTISCKVDEAIEVFVGYRSSRALPFKKVAMTSDGAGNYSAEIPVGVMTCEYYIWAENEEAGIFSPERAEHEFHSFEVMGEGLVINEFMASNQSTEKDEAAEYDDWAELFNNTDQSIDLTGYFLTDDPSNPDKWEMPEVSIEAGEYLVVWLDEDGSQGPLHANFKLSAKGEMLILSNPNLEIQDQIYFGGQEEDISYGRYPNGVGPFVEMPATFMGENQLTVGKQKVKESGIKVYPNPAKDVISVWTKDVSRKDVIITDITGKVILQTEVRDFTRISTQDWSNGTYLIRVGREDVRKIQIIR